MSREPAWKETVMTTALLETRTLGNLTHLQVLEDVGWVGHAQAEHAALGDLLHQFPQQRGQIRADVPPVSTRVLAGQPDLTHPLWNPHTHNK